VVVSAAVLLCAQLKGGMGRGHGWSWATRVVPGRCGARAVWAGGGAGRGGGWPDGELRTCATLRLLDITRERAALEKGRGNWRPSATRAMRRTALACVFTPSPSDHAHPAVVASRSPSYLRRLPC
jgi:hypothetical protein